MATGMPGSTWRSEEAAPWLVPRFLRARMARAAVAPALRAAVLETSQAIGLLWLLPKRGAAFTQLMPAAQAFAAALDAKAETDARRWLDEAQSLLRRLIEEACRACAEAAAGVGERLAAAAAAGIDGPAIDPLVRAIARVAPDAPAAADLRKSLQRARAAAGAAAAIAAARPGPGLMREARRLGAAIKAFEEAQLMTLCLRPPARRQPIEAGWQRLGGDTSIRDRVNRRYYAARGSDIYGDFATLALDPLLARADARRFLQEIAAGTRRRHGDILVLEVGVGDGGFAADFLDAVAEADEAAAARGTHAAEGAVYPRLRYLLVDASWRMLRDAAANPRLRRHAARTWFLCCDALALNLRRRVDLMRFHEVFCDLPGTSLLYRPRGGTWHELWVRPTLDPRAGATAAQARQRLASGDVTVEFLAGIDWEAELRPIDPRQLPHASRLDELAGARTDVVVPWNEGAAAFLERLLPMLAPGGTIRIYDYGLAGLAAAAADCVSTARAVRRHGGCITIDVFFPLLLAISREAGLAARVELQEQFIAEATGQTCILGSALGGPGPAAAYCRVVSAAQAPFALGELRHAAQIAAAARTEPPDAAGYARFVARIAGAGWIGPGLPLDPAPWSGSLLDNLARDLDFVVAGLFQERAMAAFRRGEMWLYRPEDLAGLEEALETIGYPPGMLARAAARPGYGWFHVLEARCAAAAPSAAGQLGS